MYQIGYVGTPSSRENIYGFFLCLPGLWVVKVVWMCPQTKTSPDSYECKSKSYIFVLLGITLIESRMHPVMAMSTVRTMCSGVRVGSVVDDEARLLPLVEEQVLP